MADERQFRLPDVGEGLTEAEVVSWKVKVGDTIAVNDIVVEIETAKSLVELPSPYAGVVSALLVDEGTTVEVGTPIISVAPAGAAAAAAPRSDTGATRAGVAPATTQADTSAHDGPEVPDLAARDDVAPGLIGGPAPGGRTSVLVGYGPRTTEATRRPRVQPSVPGSQGTGNVDVLAKPPVRFLAKQLGVALSEVSPTGPNGTISREDVQSYAAGRRAARSDRAAPDQIAPDRDMPDQTTPRQTQDEREDRVAIRGVRKATAQAMVSSAFTAPHVTEWVTIDASRTMRLVARLKKDRSYAELRVSPLLVVAKAVCVAIRRTPELNASWDEAGQQIVLKRYVNLGIAAATTRGLLVPNIKDADRMDGPRLAAAIGDLVDVARQGKTSPADQAGGTFTITNVGVFGVDAGTPILNPGETGILAIGAMRKQPWVVGRDVRPRWVTTLAVSFDHRVVDGAQGSKFLADVAAIVTDPGEALLM